LVFVAVGAAWFLLGSVALTEKRDIGGMAGAAGEFVEETLRLLVNTLSFARVGAFALGHAGLSLAVVEIALATGPLGYWIVLVLGNAVIIALEGLVVGIQTTRLVLFEFFIRFLTAGGREFTPLPPPEAATRALRRSLRSAS
jgi:V/A-type H+-transporting ATPase subunit I